MTRSLMQSSLLRAITRRHFFKQSGFGIGGLALSSLLDERLLAQRCKSLAPREYADRLGQRRRQGAALRAEGQEHHLPVHGRRAVAARPVRSQADAAGATTARRSRRSSFQGRALRVHQGHAEAARLAVHVQADTGNRARSSPSCCRTWPAIADDIAIVRSVHTTQFNHAPGADLHEHRAARCSAGRAWARG